MTLEQQLLIITMEECGELVQACSKVLRHGSTPAKMQQLVEEAGDVQVMLDLLMEHKYTTPWDIAERCDVKREKLAKWSDLL